MGTSWRGLFKIGGDGQQDVLIELQPKKAVHNKLVKNIILNSFSNKSSLLNNNARKGTAYVIGAAAFLLYTVVRLHFALFVYKKSASNLTQPNRQ